MSFNQSFGDCINITVSVPRSSFYQGSPDVNGNTQVVPGNDFSNSSFEDMVVPGNQFDAVETESFYDDFFGCMKTPDNRAKTQTYRLSSAGELRRLKKAATEKKADDSFKRKSPWRLIIEEGDIVTSSPVFKKPQSCFNNNHIKKDTDGFFKFLAKAGWRGGILAGQEYLDDLYEIARSRNDPMLLESLESFLAATIDNLLQKQSDNEKLDHALKTATEKNSEIANQLEQEMEQQVAMLEEKIRQEEQRKLDQQKEEANRQILSAQDELLEMEKKVKELEEKVISKANEVNVPDEIIDEIKRKEKENEMLQKKLLEFQTQMALMRTEVAEMKSEYDSQNERLMNERGTVLGCVQEQENLTRQLHLLHEANKKLHDTNDDLRSALDSRKYNSFMEPSISPIKRSTSAGISMRRPKDSFSSFRSDPGRPFSANSSVNNDFDDTDEDSRSILPHDEEINEASLLTELMAVGDHRFDTSVIGNRQENLSYAPDASYLENSVSNSDRVHFVKQLDVLCETNKRLGESNDELRQALSILSGQMKADHDWKQTIVSNGIQSAPVTPIRAQSVTSSYQERPQSTSSPRRVLLTKSGHHSLSMYAQRQPDEEIDEDDMDDEELVRLVDKTNEEDLSVSISEDPITVEEKILEPRGPAVGADTSTESMSSATSDMGSRDQMFKIVLAGNAAVGKSSFIIRLCKDKFYSALNSTLGVDYQVKKMNVGNDSITLQLWDTAGQERFRSIAKSYFRRVDGVVLLYDVTCENSFLDVRDWLESIESSASRRIPVIICGNKVDLRPGAEKCGMPVISTEQGRKLALSVGAMFIECSAKDGTNIEKACRDLTKQLQAAEDEYLREPGITLDEETQSKKKTGCCRS